MSLVTLTFDLLILKLVCESHQNLGTLDLRVIELFNMYATDGQTYGRTDKSKAYWPIPYGRGIIMQSSATSAFTLPTSDRSCTFLLDVEHKQTQIRSCFSDGQ